MDSPTDVYNTIIDDLVAEGIMAETDRELAFKSIAFVFRSLKEDDGIQLYFTHCHN